MSNSYMYCTSCTIICRVLTIFLNSNIFFLLFQIGPQTQDMMDLRARIESCFARRKTEDDKFVYVYLPTGEEGVGGRGALEAFANDTAAFETFVTKYKDPLVDFDGFCYEVKGKLFKVKYESGEEPENFEVRNQALFTVVQMLY